MALNTAAADALGTSIANALTALSTNDKKDPVKIWKLVIEKIYTALQTDASVTILPASIVTTGSAVTQTGPAAPIVLPLA